LLAAEDRDLSPGRVVRTKSLIETVARRQRAVVIGGLVLVCGFAWVFVLAGAGTGMSIAAMSTWQFPPPMVQPAMAGAWTAIYALAMLAMWWVMMVAMMLPSAAPVMLLHARTVRHGQRRGRMPAGPVPTVWFLAGYLLVWLGFALAAVALQWALERIGALSGAQFWSQSRWLSAGVLALAALYQISPLKRMCVAHCRAPAEYLAAHWRPGASGALRMGIGHGVFCVGCCWALMALLFVGGVMNVVWIAALTGIVLAEKLLPAGVAVGRVTAGVLAVWAAATLLV
jgi:predicted metal-binding membrane protein